MVHRHTCAVQTKATDEQLKHICVLKNVVEHDRLFIQSVKVTEDTNTFELFLGVLSPSKKCKNHKSGAYLWRSGCRSAGLKQMMKYEDLMQRMM